MLRALRSIHEYTLAWLLLALLGVICLLFSVWALLMYPLLPRRWGTAAGRMGIMAGFRAYAWILTVTGAYRLDLRALDELREGPPLILAPNHPSLIDALLILSRLPNVSCVLKGELLNNVFLGAGSRLARYIRADQPRRMIRDAIAELRTGGVLLLFPEGTRTTREPVNALRASVGVIARHAGVPVQVAIIETDSPYLGKGCPLLRRPSLPITYRIRLGRRFEPPLEVNGFMAALEREFLHELRAAPQSEWLTVAAGSELDSYSR